MLSTPVGMPLNLKEHHKDSLISSDAFEVQDGEEIISGGRALENEPHDSSAGARASENEPRDSSAGARASENEPHDSSAGDESVEHD